MTLEERIARLEAEADIRRLKARYLNACDKKDAKGMSGCFTPDAVIEFPLVNVKAGPKELEETFTELAVKTPIVDQHQGHNAEITVIDENNAKGVWHLAYTLYDPRSGIFRLLSAFYEDHYVRTPQGWLMSYSRNDARAVVDGKLEAGSVTANWIQL
ncbi:MAG: nuclear transport factor 2 family protein [Hyphomonadaceae bacterium]|nr:nuclear transport factor 2 family protein [Hyphomonadaceae bacterium]